MHNIRNTKNIYKVKESQSWNVNGPIKHVFSVSDVFNTFYSFQSCMKQLFLLVF